MTAKALAWSEKRIQELVETHLASGSPVETECDICSRREKCELLEYEWGARKMYMNIHIFYNVHGTTWTKLGRVSVPICYRCMISALRDDLRSTGVRATIAGGAFIAFAGAWAACALILFGLTGLAAWIFGIGLPIGLALLGVVMLYYGLFVGIEKPEWGVASSVDLCVKMNSRAIKHIAETTVLPEETFFYCSNLTWKTGE
jgi:hypothetical protein